MGNVLDTIEDIVQTLLDKRDKRTAEFDLFVKAFVIIEKYVVNNTQGLTNRFISEYERSDGHLDWYKVLGHRLRGHRDSMGYVEAIKMTARLLKEAKDRSKSSDRRTLLEINRSVSRLIGVRKDELDPKFHIFGWVPNGWGGEQYDRHKVVVDAWKGFKQNVFND